MGIVDERYARTDSRRGADQQPLVMMAVNDVEAMLAQESAQQARQNWIDERQLAVGRPGRELLVQRQVANPVQLDRGDTGPVPR